MTQGARREIQPLIRGHIAGIEARARDGLGDPLMRESWEQLFSVDVVVLASSAAISLVVEAVRDGEYHVQRKTFRNLSAAVGAVPSTNERKRITPFPGGSFQLVEGLLRNSGWPQDDRDVAHRSDRYEGKDRHSTHRTFVSAEALTSWQNVWMCAPTMMTGSMPFLVER